VRALPRVTTIPASGRRSLARRRRERPASPPAD
jgi:hypothetical protein